jgi:hypothetical protein
VVGVGAAAAMVGTSPLVKGHESTFLRQTHLQSRVKKIICKMLYKAAVPHYLYMNHEKSTIMNRHLSDKQTPTD